MTVNFERALPPRADRKDVLLVLDGFCTRSEQFYVTKNEGLSRFEIFCDLNFRTEGVHARLFFLFLYALW